MNKSSLLRRVASLKDQIKAHESKISSNPDSTAVGHWQGEIREFRSQLAEAESQLGGGEYEEYCGKCQREVMLRNKTCPHCKTYIG